MKEKKRPKNDKPVEEETTDAEEQDQLKNLKRVRPKIGEHKDNLKQRSEWFQKRTAK